MTIKLESGPESSALILVHEVLPRGSQIEDPVRGGRETVGGRADAKRGDLQTESRPGAMISCHADEISDASGPTHLRRVQPGL